MLQACIFQACSTEISTTKACAMQVDSVEYHRPQIVLIKAHRPESILIGVEDLPSSSRFSLLSPYSLAEGVPRSNSYRSGLKETKRIVARRRFFGTRQPRFPPSS